MTLPTYAIQWAHGRLLRRTWCGTGKVNGCGICAHEGCSAKYNVCVAVSLVKLILCSSLYQKTVMFVCADCPACDGMGMARVVKIDMGWCTCGMVVMNPSNHMQRRCGIVVQKLGFLNVWGEQLAPAHEAFRQAPFWACLLLLRVPNVRGRRRGVVCTVCGVPELSWWLGIRDEYLTLPIYDSLRLFLFFLHQTLYFRDPVRSCVDYMVLVLQHSALRDSYG